MKKPPDAFLLALAEEINEAAGSYRMGGFQELRRELHGKKRGLPPSIFTRQTVHQTYAFHLGGRRELQFNIGYEDQKRLIRFGVAFSLKSSRTLPDPLELRRKVERLNEYIRRGGPLVAHLRFWYYDQKDGSQRSTTQRARPFAESLIRPEMFLFWGRMVPKDSVRADDILAFFDRLLPVYEFVESGGPLRIKVGGGQVGLQFKPGFKPRKSVTEAILDRSNHEVSLRHNDITKALHDALVKRYGSRNVSGQSLAARRNALDVVVKDGDAFDYYEIKTGSDVRLCLREAVGQLLEYSYWPRETVARRLIVVTENELTPDAREYLQGLRDRFGLPVYYQRFVLETKGLGDLE